MNKKRKKVSAGKAEERNQPQQPNAFRAAEKKFKLYKSSTLPVDLTEVIDFANIQANTPENQHLIVPLEPHGENDTPYARMFSLKGYEGFCFICNPFSFDEQLGWVDRCLREYTEPPNITNLNLHYGPVSGLVEGLSCKDGVPQPALAGDPFHKTTANDQPPKSVLLSKLRWATLGYQYNWTDRSYNQKDWNRFPPDLAVLCERFAAKAHQELIAEAAIVNFYSLGNTLYTHARTLTSDLF